MDSLLISRAQQRHASLTRTQPGLKGTPGLATQPEARCLSGRDARRGRSPPPQEVTGGTGNAQPRPEKFHAHLKSPHIERVGGRPTPEQVARANRLASPARADVQRHVSSRDVWGSPTGGFTLQIGKSWISPVAGGEALIAPHRHFVQSSGCAVNSAGDRGWSDYDRSCTRIDSAFSLTSFVRKRCYLVEPARRAG